jgi:hypothetical protein
VWSYDETDDTFSEVLVLSCAEYTSVYIQSCQRSVTKEKLHQKQNYEAVRRKLFIPRSSVLILSSYEGELNLYVKCK